MTYQFISEQSSVRAVRRLCRVLEVSPSAYYRWRVQPVSARSRADEQLLERIRMIHQASRAVYGSPRVHAALRQEGLFCSRKRVARLMRQHGIRAKTVRRFRITTHVHRSQRTFIDLVRRRFAIDEPNRVWASDITYIWTREGWTYLAVILDLHSRRVVAWEVSARLTSELITSALQRALRVRLAPAGLVFHSDRGSQYTCDELVHIVEQYNLRQSLGLSCYDNAAAESFIHTIKTLGMKPPVRFEEQYP
jgi:putative transposase